MDYPIGCSLNRARAGQLRVCHRFDVNQRSPSLSWKCSVRLRRRLLQMPFPDSVTVQYSLLCFLLKDEAIDRVSTGGLECEQLWVERKTPQLATVLVALRTQAQSLLTGTYLGSFIFFFLLLFFCHIWNRFNFHVPHHSHLQHGFDRSAIRFIFLYVN